MNKSFIILLNENRSIYDLCYAKEIDYSYDPRWDDPEYNDEDDYIEDNQ